MLKEKLESVGFVGRADRLRLAARSALEDRDFISARKVFVGKVLADVDLLHALIEDRIDGIAEMYLRSVMGGGGRHNSAIEAVPTAAVASQGKTPAQRMPTRDFRVIAGTAKTAARAYLQRETEIGKRLGECTKDDLESLTKIHARHRYLYQALATGMPPKGSVAVYFDDRAIAEIDRKWNGGDR